MNVVNLVKDKIPESVSAVTTFTPIAAAIETYVARMPTADSLWMRGTKGAYTFLAVPLLLEGRKLGHKLFHIDSNSPAEKIDLFDSIYASALSMISTPVIYFLTSKEKDVDKLVMAWIGYTVASAIIVKPAIYSINVFKDLLGVKPMSESRKEMGLEKKLSDKKIIRQTQQYIRAKTYKFEEWLEQKSASYKKRLAAGVVISSLLLTTAVYTFSSDPIQETPNTPYKTLDVMIS